MLFVNRRRSSGNGLFANLGSGFAQCFGSIVSIRTKKLSNTNWVVSRHIKKKEASYRHFHLIRERLRRRDFLNTK